MDMGFNREHAEEALLATGNDIAASMEWILTHPPSATNTQVCPSFFTYYLSLSLTHTHTHRCYLKTSS